MKKYTYLIFALLLNNYSLSAYSIIEFDVESVADSSAFRNYNGSASTIILTDRLRGGIFKQCITCAADQYMVFTDATLPIPRKWERVNYSEVFPEYFGAKADGITNDLSAINRALAFSNVINLTAGKIYSVSSVSIVSNNKQIIGNGASFKQNQSNTSVISIYQASNIKIDGINFIGLNKNFNWTFLGSDAGVRVFQSKNIEIRNCTFTNFAACGLYLESNKNALIENNLFYEIGNGLQSTADIIEYSITAFPSYNTIISKNRMLSNNDLGLNAGGGGTFSLIFTENIMIPTTNGVDKITNPSLIKRRHGMMVGYNASPQDSAFCIISDNYVENTTACGFYCNYLSGLVFNNNITKRNGLGLYSSGILAGFRFTSCRGVVSNSIVYDFQGSDNVDHAAIGITFNADGAYNLVDSSDCQLIVKNCIVKGSTTDGVIVGSPRIGDVIFEGCNFSDYKRNGVRITGAALNPSIYGNRVQIKNCKFISDFSSEPDIFILSGSNSTKKSYYHIDGNKFYSLIKKERQIYYYDPFSSVQNESRIASLILNKNEFNNAKFGIDLGNYQINDSRYNILISGNSFSNVDTCFKINSYPSNVITGENNYNNIQSISSKSLGVLNGILHGENIELYQNKAPNYGIWKKGDIVTTTKLDTIGYICTLGGSPGVWQPKITSQNLWTEDTLGFHSFNSIKNVGIGENSTTNKLTVNGSLRLRGESSIGIIFPSGNAFRSNILTANSSWYFDNSRTLFRDPSSSYNTVFQIRPGIEGVYANYLEVPNRLSTAVKLAGWNSANYSADVLIGSPFSIVNGQLNLNGALLPTATGVNQIPISNGVNNSFILSTLAKSTTTNLLGINVSSSSIGLDIFSLPINNLSAPSNTLDFSFPSYSVFNNANYKLNATSLKNVIRGAQPNSTDFVTITTPTHIPGTQHVIVYNATSNSINVTLGATMNEGETKILKCVGNSVNTIKFSPSTGISFLVDGSTLTSSSSIYTALAGACINVTRYGNTIIIDL